MIMIIIYSENTIKIYTMTWNKIQVHILLIFYNINKHIKLLFLKPIRVASIKANIGQFFIIFTLGEFRNYRKDTLHSLLTLNYLHHSKSIYTIYILKMIMILLIKKKTHIKSYS